MSDNDFIPKPGTTLKIGGLGRKAQKLQSLRDKADQAKTGIKPNAALNEGSFKAKNSVARKAAFNRKAV